jgi:hypothetical protein
MARLEGFIRANNRYRYLIDFDPDIPAPGVSHPPPHAPPHSGPWCVTNILLAKRGPAKITHRRPALSQPDDGHSGMETGDEVSELSGASIRDFQKV